MWQAIQKLAEQFERAWSQAGYALEAFPELAERELAELLGDRALDGDAILDALSARAAWSEQLDPYTHFGEPAVTVHKTERWVLDVYLWLHPVTALHDHRFRGAFGVVDGITLESTYHFAPREPSPHGIDVGALTRQHTELLRPGSVRRILPGRDFIHQVVHIARPTVSVALRTAREPELPSQREYFAPGLAVPSLPYLSHPQRRKLELIGSLVALGGPRLEERLGELVAGEDEACAFWMLYRMFHAAGYQHELALRVLDRARSPLARLRDELASCLRTVAESSRWWSCAREEPHRLLVALATTTDDAGEIAGRIEDYAGGARTSNLVAEWLAGMKRGEEAGAARALLGRRATASLVDRLAAHAPLRALVERPDGS